MAPSWPASKFILFYFKSCLLCVGVCCWCFLLLFCCVFVLFLLCVFVVFLLFLLCVFFFGGGGVFLSQYKVYIII